MMRNKVNAERVLTTNLGQPSQVSRKVDSNRSYFAGFSDVDPVTGFHSKYNDDLKCKMSTLSQQNSNCHFPGWKDTATENKIERLIKGNLHPIKKDTITVPAGGYAVIRFVADNEGRREKGVGQNITCLN